MQGPSLSAACYAAFAAVFVVLAFLALVIHLIALAFPAPAPGGDAALFAAVSACVASQYAGARVTRIEESP